MRQIKRDGLSAYQLKALDWFYGAHKDQEAEDPFTSDLSLILFFYKQHLKEEQKERQDWLDEMKYQHGGG